MSAPRSDVVWQDLGVARMARSDLFGHRSCVVWMTGLSGAGKSTITNLVEMQLHSAGVHTCVLDGDNLRHGLNSDLGFSIADRVENNRRAAAVAKLMADAGLIVLVSLISPFRAGRAYARELLRPIEFCEVHVHAPLADAESRDPKGLYRKARSGLLPEFTGIDSPYEEPEAPEIFVDTTAVSAKLASEMIVDHLDRRGVF